MSRWPCVPKPCPGCDAVLVEDPQRPESRVSGVVVVGEGERVEGVEPAVVEVPALAGAANLDHVSSALHYAGSGRSGSLTGVRRRS